MSLINKRLTELKLSKEVVDIYRDNVTDETLTGVVGGFSSEILLLNLLTDEGEDNGISVFLREDITRLRSGGNFRTSIKELSQFRATKIKPSNIDLSSINKILTSIQSKYGYVNIHTEYVDDDVCYIGEVIEQDNIWVSLLSYGTMSSLDTSHLLIKKEEISRIDAGASYEESIKYLAAKNK